MPLKYFYDTEFQEGFRKPLFCKRSHFIDLISIGVVCEDGRSYYAVSNEFDIKECSHWVKENVLKPIYAEMTANYPFDDEDGDTIYDELKQMLKKHGKSNERIMQDLAQFITAPKGDTIELYGYYADYDHVLLCSLFGTMMDLPKDFPMYTIDLQQMKAEKEKELNIALKKMSDYPKQVNEHNALSDAQWNLDLYNYLKKK